MKKLRRPVSEHIFFEYLFDDINPKLQLEASDLLKYVRPLSEHESPSTKGLLNFMLT